MYRFDYKALKTAIDSSGMKQKYVAIKADIKENHFCLILSGRRKCEAGEYVGLCKALGVELGTFMEEVKERD